MVVDGDVQHIVLVSLNEGARKHAIDSHNRPREAIRREIGVDDVKGIEDICAKHRVDQNKGKEKLRSRRGYNHGRDLQMTPVVGAGFMRFQVAENMVESGFIFYPGTSLRQIGRDGTYAIESYWSQQKLVGEIEPFRSPNGAPNELVPIRHISEAGKEGKQLTIDNL